MPPQHLQFSNPLLSFSHDTDLSTIRPEHFAPAATTLSRTAHADLDRIVHYRGERTFENTMLVLDRAGRDLCCIVHLAKTFNELVNSKEQSSALREVATLGAAFEQRRFSDPELYSAVEEYANTIEGSSLDGPRRRFLEQTLQKFSKNGARLAPDLRGRVQQIDADLVKLTSQFLDNLLSGINAFQLTITDQRQLAGVPEWARNAAVNFALASGQEGWKIPLQNAMCSAILEYGDDRALREVIWRAANSVAAESNAPVVERVLELRREKALILGFNDFADFITVDRMAKTGDAAHRFTSTLLERVKPYARDEHDRLARLFAEHTGHPTSDFQPWDAAYYQERLRIRDYAFDQNELRPYFGLDSVLEGLVRLSREMFEKRFVPSTAISSWHPDVRVYEVFNTDEKLIGVIHLDLFSRPGTKLDGGSMAELISATTAPGDARVHVARISTNFQKPDAEGNCLLEHEEVETLFHEWGHLMHHVFSKTELVLHSGMNVAWDFVEVPSKVSQNLAWRRDILDGFARHESNGNILPDELFETMTRSRSLGEAARIFRTAGWSHVDLALHRSYDSERDGGVVEYARKLFQESSFFQLPPSYARICRFDHLFDDPTGYAAGYYSYDWSEVIEANISRRIDSWGGAGRETGARLDEFLLSTGDSKHADAIVMDLLGGPVDPDALLHERVLAGRIA